jgi:hypothetical protein
MNLRLKVHSSNIKLLLNAISLRYQSKCSIEYCKCPPTGQSQAILHVFIDARGANLVGDDVFEVVPFRQNGPHFLTP